LLHGVVVLLLLLIPWSGSATLIWMLLLILVVMESVRAQRRILSRVGPIDVSNTGQVNWRQQRWFLAAKPWQSRWMILLSLRSMHGQREKLWLFSDSMEQAEWRALRQHLLMQMKRQ